MNKPHTESGTSPPTTRRCSKCHETKSLEEFGKDRHAALGRRYDCKPCYAARARARYAANPEKRNASSAKYYAKNREKQRARHAKYNAEHREEHRAAMAKHRAANIEKERARARKYHAEHREEKRAYHASMRGVAASLRAVHGLDLPTSVEWAAVLTTPTTRCICCGVPNFIITRLISGGPWPRWMGTRLGKGARRRLELGHVVAGKNEGGFVPLCHTCNNTLDIETFAPASSRTVLVKMMRRWRDVFAAPRSLYWMNTDVDPITGHGIGGREHRNDTMAKKFNALKPGADREVA